MSGELDLYNAIYQTYPEYIVQEFVQYFLQHTEIEDIKNGQLLVVYITENNNFDYGTRTTSVPCWIRFK